MRSFEDFFRDASGVPPYGYQVRLARDGLPAVIEAPTGAGKTGAILAWLWRRLYGPAPAGTPRRLVYALPQRTLVEQVAGEVTKWLANLGVADSVALHVVMGGEGATQWRWRRDMHRPAIVVGTVDSLVSKALNRGYGIARATYPVDFALVTNGAQWIVDEIQLCPESTTTLRQLAAFTSTLGTAEPFRLTCMTATVPKHLLDTVDNPAPAADGVLRIEPADRTGQLALRLGARRTVGRLAAEPGQHKSIAAAVRQRHRPGSLTLVVVNTVEAARAIHAALRGGDVPCTLLHSRFRGNERKHLVKKVISPPEGDGHVVVATQVVEAGIDISAAVLITEAAPWPSVVQRAGRCNRTGLVDGAELWWVPPAKHFPYPQEDVAAAVAELTSLEGAAVTSEDLLARAPDVFVTAPEVTVLRRSDLLALFDTAPDLTGSDLDIAPYVRDSDDLDVQLAWASWEGAANDGRPPDSAKAPEAKWRCRVPLGQLGALVKRGVSVWRFDQALGCWSKVTSRQPARPGEVLLVAAKDGGYDLESGFDPAAKKPVPDSPDLVPTADPATGAEDAFGEDNASVAQPQWLKLEQHSEDVRDQAQALLDVMRPELPVGSASAVAVAGYTHDTGKSHDIWQTALCRLAPAGEREKIDAGRPWAKSEVPGRLRYPKGVTSFRHELVSMLLLDGPLRPLLDTVDDPDLVRYLVLAHHGKLRLQVRAPTDQDKETLLGLKHRDSAAVPMLLGQAAGELTINLDQFTLGGDRSWTRTALELRDRYGPFVLAYLETVVRIADWRASAGSKEAE